MEATLFRTGSGSIPAHVAHVPGSPRLRTSISVHDLTAGVFSGEKKTSSSPRNSLHMEVARRRIRRCSSESDIIRLEAMALTKHGSRSFHLPPIIPEDEHCTVDNKKRFGGDFPAGGISWEDLGFPGGGMNKNRTSGGGGGGYGDNGGDRCEIGVYYQKMLKSDPTNSLLLRNYGKYLHEVEGDVVKAEECYGRAILASPGDGELMSLYGKLIWETQRDESRAKSYFQQALQASPHDCSVLGSYAHFLWEAEDEDEEEELERSSPGEQLVTTMVEAF